MTLHKSQRSAFKIAGDWKRRGGFKGWRIGDNSAANKSHFSQ